MARRSRKPKCAGSKQHSSPSSRRARSTRASIGSIDKFSKAEQTILRGAAEILDVPMERLLATTDSVASHSTSSTNSNETEEAETSSSNKIFTPEGSPQDSPQNSPPIPVPTSEFPLRLPDFSQRSSHIRAKQDTVNEVAGAVFDPWTPETSETITRASNLLTLPGSTWTTDNSFACDLDLDLNGGNWAWLDPNGALGGLPTSSARAPNSYGSLPQDLPSTSHVQFDMLWSSSIEPPFGLEPPFGMNEPLLSDAQASANAKTPIPSDASPPEKQPVERLGGSKKKWRGPFQSPEQRQATSLTRRLGACIRCSLQRIRCHPDPANPNGCCLTCKQAVRTRVYLQPCLRYRITDAELLDHDVCPRPSWTRRWKKMEVLDIQDWSSAETKMITLTQDVGGTTFDLRVKKFIPVEGDSLERKWKTGGVEQVFRCPPYAIANMHEAGRTLARFVDDTLGDAISYYIDEDDKLLRSTYSMAYRYSIFAESEKERRLLRSVLRLWAASRLSCRSVRICSQETLGMMPQDYGPDCANSGVILVPPVLTAQNEVIVTALILQPVAKEVLKRLKALMEENQRRYWFTIYLSTFVLLHSCALLTAGDNKKARKQGFNARFFRTPLVEGLHNGAKILLAYFHYCNKGSRPFTMDWTSPEQIARAELNAEQAQFMQDTVAEVEKKAARFQQIRQNGEFEHDYYFLAQLYDLDWKPTQTI